MDGALTDTLSVRSFSAAVSCAPRVNDMSVHHRRGSRRHTCGGPGGSGRGSLQLRPCCARLLR
eukprot:8862641-Pyramimonas_sp.AAC.1